MFSLPVASETAEGTIAQPIVVQDDVNEFRSFLWAIHAWHVDLQVSRLELTVIAPRNSCVYPQSRLSKESDVFAHSKVGA